MTQNSKEIKESYIDIKNKISNFHLYEIIISLSFAIGLTGIMVGMLHSNRTCIDISMFILVGIFFPVFCIFKKDNKELIKKYEEDVKAHKNEILSLFENKKDETSKNICSYLKNDLNDLKLDIHMLEKIFKKLNKSHKKEKIIKETI